MTLSVRLKAIYSTQPKLYWSFTMKKKSNEVILNDVSINEIVSNKFHGLRFNLKESNSTVSLTSAYISITMYKKKGMIEYIISKYSALVEKDFKKVRFFEVDSCLLSAFVDTIDAIHEDIRTYVSSFSNSINTLTNIIDIVNWNSAPYWANYYIVDEDGEAYFYEKEPTLVKDEYGNKYWWFKDQYGNPLPPDDKQLPFFEYAVIYKNAVVNQLYTRPNYF